MCLVKIAGVWGDNVQGGKGSTGCTGCAQVLHGLQMSTGPVRCWLHGALIHMTGQDKTAATHVGVLLAVGRSLLTVSAG